MSITIPDRVVVFDYGEVISRTPTDADRAALLALAVLHAGGTRLAILSNAGADFASGFRFSPLGAFFERVFVSAEMEAIKPDPAIYLEVAQGLGIAPEQMVFIDTKSVNTDAAAALGMSVHHFTGIEGLERFLRSLT